MENSSSVEICMWAKEFWFYITWKQASVFCISLFQHSEVNTVLKTVLSEKYSSKNIKDSNLPKTYYAKTLYRNIYIYI